MGFEKGTSEPAGVVFNVQRASLHDGPGIRTTVFLKGCPLCCPWCHNPEGVAFEPEIAFNPDRCLECGSCIAACQRPDGPLPAGRVLGSEDCAACRACTDACPTGARDVAGRAWTVSAVLAEALRDLPAYEESGGGVTFSGGEPLAQPGFLLACLVACRGAGLRTAVDTCGFAARDVVAEVASRTDLLLWDLKTLDPGRHLALTGVQLAPILDNLVWVARLGTPLWLRIPVIPGVNDDDAGAAAAARLAARTPAVRRVNLLPYHRTGASKRRRLGREATLPGIGPPPPERMEALAAVFRSAGVETTIGG